MSLATQSQTWFPTSVQVTVHQARGLRVKGKNGTNDTYAIIQVAKDKFSTAVAEKSISPVWKEEASFDLPLFHASNVERCTLYITAMHRSHMGLDKFLGQAVVNLLELFENKSRKKTDWFKLVDKTGKEDKPRGEVLLDIQFKRNNMSASMFDLSLQDKPSSRMSKLKDKVRRKKKDGYSDSASAIVSSSGQVLTDSEGEADTQSLSQSSGVKKKSKLKTLFTPKSNLQRNISQSLSTLRNLPENNSSLSGSRSSGLSVDPPEVKKTLKILGHKRTASSDSRTSQGPVSLLGGSKQNNSDLNNLCINGSHVYTEKTKTSSTISLNSIGQGSVDDVLKHTSLAGNRQTYCVQSDREILEQQCHLQQEEKRQAEEKFIAEAKRSEEEEKNRIEAKRVKEEQELRSHEELEKKRCIVDDEEQRKKQREEVEESRKQAEELKMLELEGNQRLEEECYREEEQNQQDEVSMSERLTSLFGMIKKKKEEVHQDINDVPPTQPPLNDYSEPISSHSKNPFEDIPLSSDPVGTSGSQKASISQQVPSASVFLNRTAKVSAVKPRLTQSLEYETYDCKFFSDLCPSPPTTESSLSFVPPDFPNILSSADSSLVPVDIQIIPYSSVCDSIKNIYSLETSVSMAEKKRALLPPSYLQQQTQNGGNQIKVKEIDNPVYEEEATSQQRKKMSIPLPDYETLFPQKRHGVQGHTQWDHIIAEVNQKHMDTYPKFLGKEMNVDGPDDNDPTISSAQKTNPTLNYYQIKTQDTKVANSQTIATLSPSKLAISPHTQPISDSSQREDQNFAQFPVGSSSSAVQKPVHTLATIRKSVSVRSRDEEFKVLQSSVPVPQKMGQMNAPDAQPSENRKNTQITITKDVPTAKPRQKSNANQLIQEHVSAVKPVASSLTSNTNMSGMDTNGQWTENFALFDPFPSADLLSKDPWTQMTNNKQDHFTGSGQEERQFEDCGMTVEDLNDVFGQNISVDPFANFNGDNLNKNDEKKDSKQGSLSFKRMQNQSSASNNQSNNKTLKLSESSIHRRCDPISSARSTRNEPPGQIPQSDEKMPNAVSGREDPFGIEPVSVIPPRTFSDSLQIVMEEPMEYQSENGSGGKMPLRARVLPSEVQPVSAQNIFGSGLVFSQRRPHPVKPMSSTESQHPISDPALKEINVRECTPGKIQVTDSESRPYTQLTQEELITLVVKQQSDLSRKNAKIVQLEEYIDNLLVRVIEEKPSILQCLQPLK